MNPEVKLNFNEMRDLSTLIIQSGTTKYGTNVSQSEH